MYEKCPLHLNIVSSSYQKIPESVAEHRSLLIPVSVSNQNCVFISISLKYLPVIYLS